MADVNNQKPSTPNFNEMEQEVLKFWDENKIFEKSLEQTKGGAPYIFFDGPPFATGLPHYGHILASTIKDAIPRYHTMKGQYVRRRWGWDCHGLPIENIVEQKLHISGKKQIEEVGVDKFNQVCRENVLAFANEWGRMVHRMGRWVEFENSYKTMDTTYQESVWWALKQVWDKGLVYEDRKVLLYCSRCETPISNFEVAMDNSYRDITEESVYAKFKLLPRQRFADNLSDEKTFMLAWTTTPWTLPGNTSLNIGPDIRYVLVEQNGERLVLAKDRLEVLENPYDIISEFSARSLEGLQYEPLYPGVVDNSEGHAHKIYLAGFVTTQDGTGVVHNAALYGEDDYNLAKEKGLPKTEMLDHQGKFMDNAPENLRGLFFKDADKVVLEELKGKGLVYKTQHYLHSYPHCYRCGTPLFYNALPAWFINIQKIKPRLRQLNDEQITWYPSFLKYGRFDKSMESAPDWNISRNRYWATALPIWKCENKECRNVVCIGSIEELYKQSSNFKEVYPNYEPGTTNIEHLDLHKPYIDRVKVICEKCGKSMSRIPEVVDCWVESASMPFAELHYPFENRELFEQRKQADFVAEYIGQTRAWFYVMHVMSTVLFDRAPFKNVVTTGNILAEDGSKMSKSKNNFPDPWKLLEQYGIDAIRFYLLTSPVMNADDVNFSEKGVHEVNRKVSLLFYNMWTFFRLYEKQVIDLNVNRQDITNVLDQWVLAKLKEVHDKVTKYLDGYDTVRAGKLIAEFIDELSTWYVRRSRDRIKEGSAESAQTLKVLGFVLSEVCKMLAPFMPFLPDRIYRDITGKESVHLQRWSELPQDFADSNLVDQMELVREIVSVGLAARKEKSLPVRQPLRAASFTTKQEGLVLGQGLDRLILEELNVKALDKNLLDKDTRPNNTIILPGTARVQYFYLDPNLNEELKKEGLSREMERQVQDLRKKSGLQVGELVDVYYNTTDDELETVLLNLLDRKKTFISQIKKSLEVEVDYETQAEVGGRAVWLGMVKI